MTYNVNNPINHYVNLNLGEEDENDDKKKKKNQNHGVLKNWVETMIRNIVSEFSYDQLTSDTLIIKDNHHQCQQHLLVHCQC